jgi:hypothetical protein
MRKFDVEGRRLTASEEKGDVHFSLRHGETPNEEQIHRFIEICNHFNNTNPNDVIGMIASLNMSPTGESLP